MPKLARNVPADIDRYQYGYDNNSNRLWKANPLGTAAISGGVDELYTYDALNRLADMQRGTLAPNRSQILGTASQEQDWTLDITGNWNGFNTLASGSTTLSQTRTQNTVNEITGISASIGSTWATPTYDAAGNTITFPQPANLTSSYTAVYDAWNRMVKVSDSGTTVAQYQYDGANRRIVKLTYTGGTLSETRHFYFNYLWQDLEECVGTSTSMDKQYVWSIRYIDELICRDDATPRRLYVTQDANFNVTGLVNTSGTVEERFLYEPYGNAEVLDASWAAATDPYNWTYLHQGGAFDPVNGMYTFRNRIYHPSLGRWMQRDPVGYSGGINLYLYILSSPTDHTDPYGLQTTAPCNQCGPDITHQLISMAFNVSTQWAALSWAAKLKLDAETTIPGFAFVAWDINLLNGSALNNAACGSGSGSCAGTVTVAGRCYQQIAVNYWLAGLIYNALDSQWYTEPDAKTFELEVIAYTTGKGATGDPVAQKQYWFFAGARANPYNVPQSTNYTNCTPCSSSRTTVTWNWWNLVGTEQ